MEDKNVLMCAKIAGGTAVAFVISYVAWKRLKRHVGKEYPADTVVFHQPGRGPNVPSMTPFAVKLETYLRMANIPYVNVFSLERSKKNKFPWIEYNGEQVADSEFCIEYLNRRLGIDLDKKFTDREKGQARAFQKMLEENTYWTLVLDRWVFNKKYPVREVFKIPFYLWFLMKRNITNMAYAAGMGRHMQEEVYHIMDLDLKALSDFLGQNKFLLGDTPCQADCAVFGQLTEMYWQSFGTEMLTVIKKYKNLCDYCERMKEKFWPDWDKCTLEGIKNATK